MKQLNFLFNRKNISTTDIAIFLRQFATLIAAGIPLIQSCEILEKSQEKTACRSLIYAIKREMLTGKTLFYCLHLHPKQFDSLTCHLIKMGEHTGKLDSVLMTIADHHEKNLAFIKRIKQALFYPCLITLTAFIVTFCMLLFVIPRFAELFYATQTSLPLLTVWIFSLSAALKHHLGMGAGLLLIGGLYLYYGAGYHQLRNCLQRLMTYLPLIKTYVRKIILARFVRNLAITFTAGLAITDALSLAANTTGDAQFIKLIRHLSNKIQAGVSLHQAMETLAYFPNLMVQMVKIGEESGMLTHMLDKMAVFLESEIEQVIIILSELLEPLIMIVLGVLIGGLVIAMYLPIFKLGSAL